MKQTFKNVGVVIAALAVMAGGASAVSAQPTQAPGGESCLPVPGAECGTVRVPLQRAHPELGSTTVAYAVIRHRDTSRPTKGTVAVNPGGPGDSAIASAASYVQLFGDLLNDHDLLLIDPRGVYRSDPIDCEALRSLPATRDGFVRAIGECGRTLGTRARGYTSAEIADDFDAVRAKLGIERLDLLGQSYGTYLMAVYAQRHPARVRSVVLSSAYPLAFDMWGRPNVRAARRAIELVCERSGGECKGDQVLRDIARLAGRLRERPIPYTLEGDSRQRKLDDTALTSIVYGSTAQAPEAIGDVPAMVRTALRGDNTLLIAAARQQAPMSRSAAPQEERPFNPPQAAAVICNDYPKLWDRKAPVSTRLRQFSAGLAALPERTYWPFGKEAWTNSMTAEGNACIRWPDRDGPVQPVDGPFPDVPVLVVSGDLDANTPTESGRLAARQFRRSTVVEVPNVGHVTEKEPSGCAAGIETGFIRNLRVGDTSCLTKIPPVPVRR